MRSTLAAVALGGAGGALARYGLAELFPVQVGLFPWNTFAVNLSGCLLIGVLMAWPSARSAPDWLRPLLGIGFLGGYTTFSTYAVETGRLFRDGYPQTGIAYLLATVLGALAAVWVGAFLARRIIKGARR